MACWGSVPKRWVVPWVYSIVVKRKNIDTPDRSGPSLVEDVVRPSSRGGSRTAPTLFVGDGETPPLRIDPDKLSPPNLKKKFAPSHSLNFGENSEVMPSLIPSFHWAQLRSRKELEERDWPPPDDDHPWPPKSLEMGPSLVSTFQRSPRRDRVR